MAVLPKKVLLGWETVFGQTPASPTPYQLCVKTQGLVHTRETEIQDCIGGDIDSGGDKLVTGSSNNGSIDASAYWEQLGVYLKAILGAPTTVDNLDGTFTHTFDTTKDVIPSMYIETTSGANDLVEVFNGVMASTFNTSFKGKGIPAINLGLVGSTHKDNLKDAYTPIVDTGKIVLGSTALNMMYTYAKIDNSDFMKLSEFDVTFDRGIEVDDLIYDTKDVGITKSEVTGSLKSVFDSGLYTKLAANNVVKVEIGYMQTIGADAHALSFLFDETQFDFKTEPKEVGNKVSVNADWSAKRSATGTQRGKVTLTNTVASY